MKGSAVTHEAKPQDDSSPFQRFAKTMRALVSVPKRELEEGLKKEREGRSAKQKAKRRIRGR